MPEEIELASLNVRVDSQEEARATFLDVLFRSAQLLLDQDRAHQLEHLALILDQRTENWTPVLSIDINSIWVMAPSTIEYEDLMRFFDGRS